MNSKASKHDEANRGLHALLGNPILYTAFGQMMGLSDKYKMYVDKFIKPFNNMRILDIGCGTASILNFLPSTVSYTGYDINPEYIKYAKKKYGNRGDFHNDRVSDMVFVDSKTYDVVLADGLLHHLNEIEAEKLFEIGHKILTDYGFMLTIDPTFIPGQNRLDRFLTSIDRGRHVRCPEEYKRIAESTFKKIEVHIITGVSKLPLTGCILKCRKA